MPRYIDADKADVEQISCYYGGNCHIEDVQEWLNEQPTADVEPVVNCKDCEYWTKQVDSLQGRCALGGHYPTGGWYCANGERRSDA